MTFDICKIGNLEPHFLRRRQEAMRTSRADLVMLLNSDIEVSGFEQSLRLFEDPKLFAITFSPGSSNTGSVRRVSYANGGSSIYRREAWNRIGGIDLMFEPYWFDDVDYSVRATAADYYIVEDGRITVEQVSRMGTEVLKRRVHGVLIYLRNYCLYHRKHNVAYRVGERFYLWPFIIWAKIRYRRFYGF